MMIRCALGGLVIILLMPGQGSMGIIQVLLVHRQVTAVLVLLQLSLQLRHHTAFSVHEISTTSVPHRYEGSAATDHLCAEAAVDLIEGASCNLRLQSPAWLVGPLTACAKHCMNIGRLADLLLAALSILSLLLGFLGILEAGLGLHGVQMRLLSMLQGLQRLVMVILLHRCHGKLVPWESQL